LTAFKSSLNKGIFTLLICLGLAQTAFAQAPVLAVSPSTLMLNYTAGSAAPAGIPIMVTAASGTGAATVNSTSITYSSGGPTGWLLIPTPTGAPGLSIPATFNIYLVNLASLPVGTYSANVTLNYSGADPTSANVVAVFLTVSAASTGGGTNPNETIVTSPTALAFSYAAGGSTPTPQALTVTVGDGAAFTTSAVTNDGNPWLVVTPTATATIVNVSVNASALSPGTYSGLITISASGAIAQVPVTLTVGGVGLMVTPTQLAFTLPQNYGFSPPQTISVISSVPATVSAIASSDYGWLVLDTPTAATPAAISLRANTTNLTTGSYFGMVTVQTSPSNATVIPVTLTVGPSATLQLAPGSVSFSYTIASAVPPLQTTSVKSLTGAVQTFTVTSTTNDGAAWLSATATSPTPGSVTISVNPTILAAGSYSGVVSVTPAGAGLSPQPIAVSLTVLPPPTPVVNAVVSSASYGASAIAPGEFVTLFGAALGPAALTTPPAGTYPTTLGGTSVTFSGIAAPILYSSATQVGVQVPYGIAIGQTIVSLQRNGVSSTLKPVPSVAAFPGFFTSNFSGTGQIAALNQDYSLNSASNPAARGSVIILYATGEGVTVPASVEGMVTTLVPPFPATQLPVSVTFQGIPAVLQYAGETPGVVSGLMQINAVVPATSPTGAAIPVLLSINGQSTPGGTTVAVK
jgi:uncharacterized protein (TIGR03437 family)